MKTPVIGVFEGGGIKGIALAGAAAAAMDTGYEFDAVVGTSTRCPGRIAHHRRLQPARAPREGLPARLAIPDGPGPDWWHSRDWKASGAGAAQGYVPGRGDREGVIEAARRARHPHLRRYPRRKTPYRRHRPDPYPRHRAAQRPRIVRHRPPVVPRRQSRADVVLGAVHIPARHHSRSPHR